MNKYDYYKLVLNSETVFIHDWVFSAFAVSTMPEPDSPYPYQLMCRDWGYEFWDDEAKKYVKIDDAVANEPLFNITERIQVDNTWAINISKPNIISVGNLLGNKYLIEYSFGSKIECPIGPISIGSYIESNIARRLKDTPKEGETRSNDVIYVDEYVKFGDALQSIKCFDSLFSYAATPKNIVAAPGIDEFKAKLNKEYADKDLDDPLTLAGYEAKLKDFDKDYMKDDPSYGKFTSGKTMSMHRKKMFLVVGAEQLKFDDSKKSKAVTNSLREGWPTDPEQFVAMLNSARIGSYARGAETVKGGVSAKILVRACNNYSVSDNDCGSKLGITRLYDEEFINRLVDVYVLQKDGKPVLVTEETKGQYLGKVLTTRSPFFCKEKGEVICKVCAGERLFRFKDGLAIAVVEISSIILAASMAAMHGKVLSTARIDLKRHFS